MIPLKDDVPSRRLPIITFAILAANIAVYVRYLMLPAPVREQMVIRMAVIPYELTDLGPTQPGLLAYNAATLLTSMFVHGGIWHLAGNMLYLWIFGSNVEDVMGRGRFLVFYLVCGLAAALTQIAVQPHSKVPMIGASGAIAGVLGAYLVMFPAARVMTLIFLFVFVRVVPIPALIVLGVWLLIQLINAQPGTGGGVAWFAHIGGFAMGLAAIVPFRTRKVRGSLY